MMHGSTSPFYPMIACLDVATAMMDGPGGLDLVEEAIFEAVQFRKRIVNLGRELEKGTDGGAPWFFGVWQPEVVRDPVSNKVSPFADVPDALLATEPSCWSLEAGQSWHGFGDLDSGYCMLDPTKVTVTTPGSTRRVISPRQGSLHRSWPATSTTIGLKWRRRATTACSSCSP